MTRLLQWMREKGIKPYSQNSDLLKAVGVKHIQLGDIAMGKKRPSPETAAQIEAATGGEVTVRDLLLPKAPALSSEQQAHG